MAEKLNDVAIMHICYQQQLSMRKSSWVTGVDRKRIAAWFKVFRENEQVRHLRLRSIRSKR